ncbi:MAG: hypothetical protein JW838_15725 [Spirochaetes bacterium]|nr:hypothetical protein [Spirochaetota bacterium]
MRYEIELMQRLFLKYRLTNPLPADVQEHAYREKRKTLISILKKLGLFSPLYGVIVVVYLALRKLGFGIGVAQSAVVFFVASAITTAGVAVGGYTAVKILSAGTPPPAEQEEMDMTTTPVMHDVARQQHSAHTDVSAYDLIIQFYGLENNGADEAMVQRVSGALTDEILRLKGNNRAIFVSAPSETVWLLSGSVEKLDTSFLLTVRLTNRRTRKIIFAVSEEATSEEDLIQAGFRFARPITEAIRE